MVVDRRILLHIVLALGTVLPACAAPERTSPAPSNAPRESGAPRTSRITVVVANEPASLYYTLAPAATRGSAGILFDFLGPGLSLDDGEGTLRPLLVEAIPSIENG